MGNLLRVLLVEDSENDAVLLARRLSRGGFHPRVERVDTQEAMAAALKNHAWDVVISDYSMPHFSGLDALAVLKQSGLDLPFILMSGTIGEDVAVAAMKAGAHDYVMKNNSERLVTAIERELREFHIRRERQQAEEWIRYVANYDDLTDLPNRHLFYDRLDKALIASPDEHKPLAVMLLDLNDFKEINDTLGHQMGDLLLQQVGLRLCSAFRDGDTIARFGGDEFGLLLPDVDEPAAILAAQKIRKALDSPFSLGQLAVDARASVGIALFPNHGEDKETLVRHADVAMYLAKQSTASYTIYSPSRDSYSAERLTLLAELQHSVEKKQLFLEYQPKVDLRTGRVIGVEALARWQHPELGRIPPDQFIAMAERTGFIRELTFWGLNAALSQARAWIEQGLELTVSVNLSARVLHNVNFPDRVGEILRANGLRPEQLELEITETAIMADPARALEILTQISRMGVALSIDDFGTGYSSLGYLKRLPVNAVKIDKSFVMNMTTNENDAVIVRSTIDLAHDLRLKAIAEGVENRGSWDALVALGCDVAQGYYMSRPLPAKEMTRWLYEPSWLNQSPADKMEQNGDVQSSIVEHGHTRARSANHG